VEPCQNLSCIFASLIFDFIGVINLKLSTFTTTVDTTKNKCKMVPLGQLEIAWKIHST
jgi:hypothetical protein